MVDEREGKRENGEEIGEGGERVTVVVEVGGCSGGGERKRRRKKRFRNRHSLAPPMAPLPY